MYTSLERICQHLTSSVSFVSNEFTTEDEVGAVADRASLHLGSWLLDFSFADHSGSTTVPLTIFFIPFGPIDARTKFV